MRNYKKKGRQIRAMMMAAILLCSSVPMTARADTEGEAQKKALCHTGHENCTYVEAVEGHACEYVDEEEVVIPGDATPNDATPNDADRPAHVHDENCGYVEAVEGVLCNHECEICDSLAMPLRKGQTKGTVYGDFEVSGITDLTCTFDTNKKLLTIKGKGSVTVGMAPGVKETDHCIKIETENAPGKSATVTLDGINIKHPSNSPIEAAGNGTLRLMLKENTKNYLEATENNDLPALQVGSRVGLFIEETGSLSAIAGKGTGIGGKDNVNIRSIYIEDGDILVKSSGGTGIGSGNDSSIDFIGIKKGKVTVEADDTGIGGGYNYLNGSGKCGNISISEGADVTVKAGHTGIGGGYQGEVGDISITNSNVAVSAGYTGIGCGYERNSGTITIENSEINASPSDQNNSYPAIGRCYTGSTQDIIIKDSTLNFDGFPTGIAASVIDKNKAATGTGNIFITDSDITVENAGCAIFNQAGETADPSKGKISISGGTLNTLKTCMAGINSNGAGGTIELKDSCEVKMQLPGVYGAYGIEVSGKLDVYEAQLTIELEGENGECIEGSGSVEFHDGASARIEGGGTLINMDGNASKVIFQSGSEVFLKTQGEDSLDSVIRVTNTGTIQVEDGANLRAVSNHQDSDAVRGPISGDACVVILYGSIDLAGKSIEFRDENGVSLNPAVTFNEADKYSALILTLPKPGAYTLYHDGILQKFEDEKYEEHTVMQIVAGYNPPNEILGADDTVIVPVTDFKLLKDTMTMKPGSKANLTFAFTPDNASNKAISATSSAYGVVDVFNQGHSVTLTAKGTGTATITVTTDDGGFTDTCVVTVTEEEPEGETYTLNLKGTYSGNQVTYKCAEGERVFISAGVRKGYEFVRWQADIGADIFENAKAPDTVLIMPARDVKVEVIWKKIQGPTPPPVSSNDEEEKPIDWLTSAYMGSSSGNDAEWIPLANGRWSVTVGSESPRNTRLCLNNPYAGEHQPKGGWFFFDENGIMRTGWYTDEQGKRYYLNPKQDGTQGLMQVGWTWIDGKCYYFGKGQHRTGDDHGVLITGAKTPDGYEVNDAGEWIADGVVQTR